MRMDQESLVTASYSRVEGIAGHQDQCVRAVIESENLGVHDFCFVHRVVMDRRSGFQN